MTEPVHTGIHPMKVKSIIHNRAPILTVYSALFPFVAIRITRSIAMVIPRLRKVPACVFVISSAVAASVNQSVHIAISTNNKVCYSLY